MRLDVVRHGHALPTSTIGDAGRILSPEGEAQVRRLAEDLAGEGWRPERAFSSPYTRARQTAALLLRDVPRAPRPEILGELVPDADLEELAAALEARLDGARHALIVGHLPLLGSLLVRLAGGPAGLGTASLARLELPAGWARGSARVVAVRDPAS